MPTHQDFYILSHGLYSHMTKNNIPLNTLTDVERIMKHLSIDDWCDFMAYNSSYVLRRLLSNDPKYWHRYEVQGGASKWWSEMHRVFNRQHIDNVIVPMIETHYRGFAHTILATSSASNGYKAEDVLSSTKKALSVLFAGDLVETKPLMKTVSVQLDDLDSDRRQLNEEDLQSTNCDKNTNQFYEWINTTKALFCVIKPQSQLAYGINVTNEDLIADEATDNIAFPLNVKRSLNEHLLIEIVDKITHGFTSKLTSNPSSSVGFDSNIGNNHHLVAYYFNTVVKK
jgi:hypothetical protein